MGLRTCPDNIFCVFSFYYTIMRYRLPILSITGSDSTGRSGMQADVKTIVEMGGHALSAVTAITTQGSLGLQHVHDLAPELVLSQVRSILAEDLPLAVKVGLVRQPETIEALGSMLRTTPNIVCSPGILTSDGKRLADTDAVEAIRAHLIPAATLLLTRCSEAEILLDTPIATDDDMEQAARRLLQLGARWVMLRGGLRPDGRCTAILMGQGVSRRFSSYNVEGWMQHGVGGALSTAIATRLAMGDTMTDAVNNAHNYIHSQVVYAMNPDGRHMRTSDLYNQFMSLIAAHYPAAHDVAFYADKLHVSTRYLSQLTNKQVGKSPKLVLADYLMRESKILLETTRLTVQEISLRLGFPSQTAYSRFFRQHQGQTPSDYRHNLG